MFVHIIDQNRGKSKIFLGLAVDLPEDFVYYIYILIIYGAYFRDQYRKEWVLLMSFFDSRNTEYRFPFGAVAQGTPVTFRVCMPRDWGCHSATLLINRDALPPLEIPMAWAGMRGDNHEWWAISYTPAETGLYWYGFRLGVAMGEGYLTRQSDGTAAYSPNRDGARWQLTCYEQDYVTPDWLAGGVMYQIFPDRFAASGEPKEGVPADRVMHADWNEAPEWRPDAQGRVRNNDFFGGDLKGIMQKLDYLKS